MAETLLRTKGKTFASREKILPLIAFQINKTVEEVVEIAAKATGISQWREVRENGSPGS